MSTNPLWTFSLSHYAKLPVQQQCLQLQDSAGANVNVLLFALLLATQRRLFDHQLVLHHAELLYWHEQVIAPLRQARCGVKQSHHKGGLYEAVKQSELDAERVEQDILYALLPQLAEAAPALTLAQLASWNVKAYLSLLPLTEEQVDQAAEQLIQQLIERLD